MGAVGCEFDKVGSAGFELLVLQELGKVDAIECAETDVGHRHCCGEWPHEVKIILRKKLFTEIDQKQRFS